MGTDQRFSLRWNNYQSHLVTAFDSLLEEKDFVDVSLGCEGRKLPAHKMLLSACSPYFRELLKGNPCQHPIIILRDIKYDDLFSLLQFMYNGEVNVAQDQLNSFLKSAESLKIRGLTDSDGSGGGEETARPAPPPAQHSPARDLYPPPAKRKRPYPETPSEHSPAPLQPPPSVPKRAPAVAQAAPPAQARPEPVKQEIIELGDEQYEAEPGAYTEEVDGGGGGYEQEGAMVPHGEGEEGLEGTDGAQGAYWNYDYHGQSFASRPSHEKLGLFQCPQCDKRFESPKSLSNHQAVHDGKTTCQICGRVESTRSNLNRHTKMTHPETCVDSPAAAAAVNYST